VQQPHGPVALHIAQAVVTAMGQQKHAVLLPLEAFFGAAVVVPDAGETSARNHVHDFIKGEFYSSLQMN